MHIRQRFLVFLMLVSIGPLALVSRFFLEDTGNKLNERIESSLNTAARVSQELINSNIQEGLTEKDWISTKTVFDKLVRVFPELEVRVFVNAPPHIRLLYSSNPFSKTHQVPVNWSKLPAHVILREKINGEDWRSIMMPVHQVTGQSLGYIVLSASNQSETKRLYGQYISFFLFLVGLLVILTAYFFNRSVIRPVNHLIMASKSVAEGDLSVRLSENYPDEEMKELMRNVNRMLMRLEEDQLMRTTFVSTLTHDLRTPLYAQKRVLEGIEKIKARYDDDLNLVLDTAQKSNEQVLEMVNKLLEAYQYEAGRIQILPEPINLYELVVACIDDLKPLAESDGIQLHNNVPQTIEIEADPRQLKRVFQNLISNALANIQSGKCVRIEAKDQGNFIEVHVTDNGPGVKPELLPHLFQRYFTGDSSQKLGSGLGLFICRMILELHRGTIMVNSQLGVGADFQINLPKQYLPGGTQDG
jgi:signal transduction histidine kinase